MKPDSPLVFGIHCSPSQNLGQSDPGSNDGELREGLPSVAAFNMEDRTSYQVRFIFPLLGACLLEALSWHQTNCEKPQQGVTVPIPTDPPGHVSRPTGGPGSAQFCQVSAPRKDSTGNILIKPPLSSRILGCCEPHCHPCARLGIRLRVRLISRQHPTIDCSGKRWLRNICGFQCNLIRAGEMGLDG